MGSHSKSIWKEFIKGVLIENPLLKLMIGLCSALAVSTKAENAIFMGGAATFVILFSNIIVSLFRKIIPKQVRIPIYIVIIASFVTIVDLVMRAYFPAVYESLGVWIPLIVVNCMILGRAEAFASKHPVSVSIFDGLGMGAGYTIVLLVMGVFRELFGTGKIIAFDTLIVSLGAGFEPPRILIMFPGAFLTFGFLVAIANYLTRES